jgi:hypothetical protein
MKKIEVKKIGKYYKVFVDGLVMATYSTITRRMWGATKYFLFKRHPQFEKDYRSVNDGR